MFVCLAHFFSSSVTAARYGIISHGKWQLVKSKGVSVAHQGPADRRSPISVIAGQIVTLLQVNICEYETNSLPKVIASEWFERDEMS